MILIGDVLDKLAEIPGELVHCVVTSPPYWGLRDYGVSGQIGLEPTMQEYIAKMVDVFREVRRVLRGDGVCFLNLGDSYAANKSGLKPKDLCGIPWRVALALQDDGWYLRSDIIWAKPNPMPESVTDRPTKSHEYIFLLTKSSKYFWDQEAVREENSQGAIDRFGKNPSIAVNNRKYGGMDGQTLAAMGSKTPTWQGNGRNLRTVWTIPTESFSGAHFATFPQKLVEKCIAAGTSEYGCCPQCGAAWVRVVDKTKTFESGSGKSGNPIAGKNGPNYQGGGDTIDIRKGPCIETQTIGFKPSCSCPPADPISCTVLDPFLGSGTTGLVAQKMGRKWLGIELNPEYADMAKKRINQAGGLF